MSFLTMINLYCMRVNLSIAIVAMINHTYADSLEVVSANKSSEPACEGANSTKSTKVRECFLCLLN